MRWEDLQGKTLDETSVVLERLIRYSTDCALFQADDAAADRPVLVQLFSPREESAEQLVNRFREAKFLNHRNVLRITTVGRSAPRLVYAVSEDAEYSLSDVLAQQGLSPEASRDLTLQLTRALLYLHSEGLVYCNIRAEAIWNQLSTWVLADFSRLRLSGRATNNATRLALVREHECPPEAYAGIVSPAWDVWSLGVLLRHALTADPADAGLTIPKGRILRERSLPAPFDIIVRDCLNPNPESRLRLEDVELLLSSSAAALVEEPASAVPVPSSTVVTAAIVPEEIGTSITDPPPPDTSSDFDEETHAAVPVVSPKLAIAVPLKRLTWIGCAVLACVVPFLLVRSGRVNRPLLAPDPRVQSAGAERAEADRVVNPQAHPTGELKPTPFGSRSSSEEEIKGFLERWASAVRAHDAKAEADCYGPFVDPYYGQHRVSHNAVVIDKQRLFSQIGRVRQFDVANVQITMLRDGTANVFFDKRWDFGNASTFSGAERAELKLKRFEGAWKVVGERELRVYSVRRSATSPSSSADAPQ